jgi:hypothetical protein
MQRNDTLRKNLARSTGIFAAQQGEPKECLRMEKSWLSGGALLSKRTLVRPESEQKPKYRPPLGMFRGDSALRAEISF